MTQSFFAQGIEEYTNIFGDELASAVAENNTVLTLRRKALNVSNVITHADFEIFDVEYAEYWYNLRENFQIELDAVEEEAIFVLNSVFRQLKLVLYFNMIVISFLFLSSLLFILFSSLLYSFFE